MPGPVSRRRTAVLVILYGFFTELRDELVGHLSRFRQAVSPDAGQDHRQSGIQIDPVPDGQVNRLSIFTGSQGQAQDFAPGAQFSNAAGRFSQVTYRSDQDRFCATDRRYTGKDAQVAGDAEAPRVSHAVPVYY
jgi:hypothetical protein